MQHTIVQAKIFKVDVRSRVEFTRSLDKGLNKLVVLFPADTLLPEAKVKIVLQELLAVGAAVQDHGEHTVWMNATANGHQYQFGDGDEDATTPLITDAQNLLAVYTLSAILVAHEIVFFFFLSKKPLLLTGYHNVVNVFRLSPLRQITLYGVHIIDIEEHSFGSPE